MRRFALIAVIAFSACDDARSAGTLDAGADANQASGQADGGRADAIAPAPHPDTGPPPPDAAPPGPDAAPQPGDAAAADAGPAGPTVYIHVRATAAPFDHQDEWSGQTPANHVNGIRAFSLLRDRDDPSPLLVFDHGSGYVEAGYDDGDDTIVGSAPNSSLEAGVYTFGRVTLSHLRYRVEATMHAAGRDLPGVFDNVQVLSDGTEIDGEIRDRGWFRYVFQVAGMSFPIEGDDGAPVPTAPIGAPMETSIAGGSTRLLFPVHIVIDPSWPDDVHEVIEFNVFESFRWEDQEGDGYAVGVFDTTPVAYEPVRRFGANSYRHFTE